MPARGGSRSKRRPSRLAGYIAIITIPGLKRGEGEEGDWAILVKGSGRLRAVPPKRSPETTNRSQASGRIAKVVASNMPCAITAGQSDRCKTIIVPKPIPSSPVRITASGP